jgi:hypothetical protein
MRTFVHTGVLFLIVLFLGMDSAHAQSKLEVYRSNVLALRIDRFIKARQNSLLKCELSEPTAMALYMKVQALSLPFHHSKDPSAENIMALMDAYRAGEDYQREMKDASSRCAPLFIQADQKIYRDERKMFAPVYLAGALERLPWQSQSPIEKILHDMDPVCDTQAQPDYRQKKADGNPCFAAFTTLAASLRDQDGLFDLAGAQTDEWLASLQEAIHSSEQNSKIDFLKIASDALRKKANRKRFLAIIAYLYSSGGSAIGMANPADDALWSDPLVRGSDSIDAYNQYFLWKNRTDLMGELVYQARSKKQVLVFGSTNVNEWNRHQFISSFIACDYTMRGKLGLASFVPNALGIAYESMDFVSHLKEGISWKDSEKNFEVDTARHRAGAKLGIAFCR